MPGKHILIFFLYYSYIKHISGTAIRDHTRYISYNNKNEDDHDITTKCIWRLIKCQHR